jgi:hypothetical protein
MMQLQLIINQVEDAIKYAEENQLTNTQEFINFLDTLNEMSIRY